MRVLKYNKELKIENLMSLRPGLGAKYLECCTHASETGETIIAMTWRRKLPKGIPAWHVLIEF